MHPNGFGFDSDAISITYRAMLSAESKEPAFAEVKSEDDSLIREDLMRLLKVWDTLSDGTKGFLQMQATLTQPAASLSIRPPPALPAIAPAAGTPTGGGINTATASALLGALNGTKTTNTHPHTHTHTHTTCPKTRLRLEPLPRAPENVFLLRDPQTNEHQGWRNTFSLDISYDVEMCPDLLSFPNKALAHKHIPADLLRRRFVVIDANVHEFYARELDEYFNHHGINAHVMVLPGEEWNKRQEAVTSILEELTIFGLRRREPIVAIGGGVILDIVGMAANLYRRGVPYIRVPTTLLAIVDASVGVKNGVDFDSRACGCQKNRVGSFYACSAALLDKSFIRTQDDRNIINGLGEIMKLALVRSPELFSLLETHGPRLVAEKFQGRDGVADRVIELSIQIMLEELGPNLWEERLERCVDFGHTFSKIIEMLPGVDIMHGEAVNVDGFLSVILSRRRGLCSTADRDRIFGAMQSIGLPTMIPHIHTHTHTHTHIVEMLVKGLEDAVEHRHGAQRIPLITGIGASVCVNDITKEELEGAVKELLQVHGLVLPK